ncbi:MAG: biotin--[acetyl-CoA-carboxylase] ligase [Microthrixaceae bacterium]
MGRADGLHQCRPDRRRPARRTRAGPRRRRADSGPWPAGRTWTSAPGDALLCSVLVRPPLTWIDPHVVTSALALAATDAVREHAGVELGVKWPNDLVAGRTSRIDDRKVAGILAESVAQGGRVAAVVGGIGLNLATPDVAVAAGSTPPVGVVELATDATSDTPPVDPVHLAVTMVRGLERWLSTVDRSGRSPRIAAAVTRRSATLGRRVRVERGAVGATLFGDAVGIEEDGRLLVAREDGVVEAIAVGDVVHLHPDDQR